MINSTNSIPCKDSVIIARPLMQKKEVTQCLFAINNDKTIFNFHSTITIFCLLVTQSKTKPIYVNGIGGYGRISDFTGRKSLCNKLIDVLTSEKSMAEIEQQDTSCERQDGTVQPSGSIRPLTGYFTSCPTAGASISARIGLVSAVYDTSGIIVVQLGTNLVDFDVDAISESFCEVQKSPKMIVEIRENNGDSNTIDFQFYNCNLQTEYCFEPVDRSKLLSNSNLVEPEPAGLKI